MQNNNKIEDNENIQFNFDESYETYDEHSIDLFKLINDFENIKINDLDLDLESVSASQILNYQINYTVKQLILICDYYGISKEIKVNKCNKNDIINKLVIFENDINNEDTVLKRQNMWFYINELKNDPIMKKYVLW